MRITENFTLTELTHSNTAKAKGIANIPNEVQKVELTNLTVSVLQPIRDLVKVPIIISSGFRNEEVNALVGGVKNSQHSKGQAADINAKGISARELFRRIISSTIVFDQAILYDNGRNNFVHVSFNKHNNRAQVLYSKGTQPL